MPLQEHKQGAGVGIARRLDALLYDRLSGSSRIADRTVSLLLERIRGTEKDTVSADVTRLIRRLTGAFPAMALLEDLSQHLAAAQRESRSLPSDRRFELVAARLRAWRRGQRCAREAVVEQAARVLRGRGPLLLLSSSGLAMATCRRLNEQRRLHLIVCESRPAREGVIMARRLSRAGCDVTVICDAAMGSWVPRTSAVVLGADWTDRAGFVNKTGSLALSLIARAAGKSVYVLADRARWRRRILRASDLPVHDPAELLRRTSPSLRAANAYFEPVPWLPIHRLVDEYGVRVPLRRQMSSGTPR